MTMKLFAALILFLSIETLAEDVFNFERVNLRGTGCPQGTASVIMSPDQQSMSILFDRFTAEVPQANAINDNDEAPIENGRRPHKMDRQMDHKICRMEITASIPVGQKVESLKASIDFRGSTVLDEKTRGSFRSEMLKWEGIKGRGGNGRAIENKTWIGPVMDNWVISKVQNLDVKSNCVRRDFKRDEKKIVFVLQNVLVARSMGKNTEASAMLIMDSADMSGSLKLKIKTASCEDPIPGPGPGPRPRPHNRNIKREVLESVNLSPSLDELEHEVIF